MCQCHEICTLQLLSTMYSKLTHQGSLIGMLKYFRIGLRFRENIRIKKLALDNYLFLCIVMCSHILFFYPIIPLKATEIMIQSRTLNVFNKTAVRHTFLPDNINILSSSHFSKNFKLYIFLSGPLLFPALRLPDGEQVSGG